MKATFRPQRVRRFVKRAFAVVLALEVLYVLVANVFLGTGLLRHLTNYDPMTTRIEYGRAWSVLPGIVHVDDLRIRGRDGHVEWFLRMDQARFRVAFTPLIHKHFQASDVRIDGLSLHLRFRLGPDEALGHVDALPDIPGFASPPLRDAAPPKPAQSDAEYHSWTVKLSNVDLRHAHRVGDDHRPVARHHGSPAEEPRARRSTRDEEDPGAPHGRSSPPVSACAWCPLA